MIAEFDVETTQLRSGLKHLRVRVERVPDGIDIRLHQTGPTVAASKPLAGVVLPEAVAVQVARAILDDAEASEEAAFASAGAPLTPDPTESDPFGV